MSKESLIDDFLKNYMPKIFYFLLKKTSSETEAEDITQDVALSVLELINKDKQIDSFSGYVWKITKNKYAKWAKSRKIVFLEFDDIEDENSNIIDNIIKEDEVNLLRRELAFIKKEYRECLVNYYFKNLTIEEISFKLNQSKSCVYQRLHRARELLKEGMSMNRKFGKRSYDPEDISFVMSGTLGKKGQPWSIITHALYKNIFLECYENPTSKENLSLELGVALPYMEDELKFLLREKMLRLENNLYVTNFKIISKEEQLMNYNTNLKYVKDICEKLCKLADIYLLETNYIEYKYVNYENAKWCVLMRLFDDLTDKENSTDNYIKHDNGCWTLSGFELPVDFKRPTFVGLHGYIDENNINDINFGQYKFHYKDMYNKTKEYLKYDEVKTLLAVVNNNYVDNKVVTDLIDLGYLKNINSVITPNIIIYDTKAQIDNEVLNEIRKTKNEIKNLLLNTNKLERGYILECALESGYLKYNEETIRTVGAYIYT